MPGGCWFCYIGQLLNPSAYLDLDLDWSRTSKATVHPSLKRIALPSSSPPPPLIVASSWCCMWELALITVFEVPICPEHCCILLPNHCIDVTYLISAFCTSISYLRTYLCLYPASLPAILEEGGVNSLNWQGNCHFSLTHFSVVTHWIALYIV